MIQIEAVDIPTKGIGNLLSISVGNITIASGNGASIFWSILREPTDETAIELSTVEVMNGTLFMPESVYDQWSDDDSYVVDWVCEQLGLTKVV